MSNPRPDVNRLFQHFGLDPAAYRQIRRPEPTASEGAAKSAAGAGSAESTAESPSGHARAAQS